MSNISLYCPKTTIELPESVKGKTWAEQGKFLTELAIPFISLYKPAGGALSLGMGTWNVAQSGALIIWGRRENLGTNILALARGVALLGAAYFQHKRLVIFSSTSELIYNLSLLVQASPGNRGEHFSRSLSAAFHLLTALQPCSLHWQMASLVVQALFEFYQAVQVAAKPSDRGYERALTITAKVAMGTIRLYQACLFLEQIRRQNDVKERVKEAQENLKADETLEESQPLDEAAEKKNQNLKADETLEESQPLDEATEEENQNLKADETIDETGEDTQPLDEAAEKKNQNLKADETLEESQPLDEAAEEKNQNLKADETLEESQPLDETWGENHPLQNLGKQIEQKRVVLHHPVKDEKYDFGAFFHGYGKGMVRGDVLRFKTKTKENGTTSTELSFKINQFYFDKLKALLESQGKFPDHESGIRNIPCQDQSSTRKCKIELYGKGIESYDYNRGILNGIKISLKGQEIETFQRELASLGLGQAVEPSSPEDLQKTKLLFLLENFYPQAADRLRKEEGCSTLSLDELRQKIVTTTPPMKDYLDRYTVQEQEIFPGFIRLSIPIEEEIYALGGRALTCILVDRRYDTEFSVDLPSEQLLRVATIVHNGMLSLEKRSEGGIQPSGGYDDGNPEVNYTQMIWERDVKNRTEIDSLGYSEKGDVRLYFSLSALNRGSYQYNKGLYGANKGPAYENRKNIFDFMANFPFRKKEAVKYHEFMLADRILPEEIQGMSVPSEKAKEQIVECFRTCGLIQTDSLGQERIHGIPVDQFISSDERLPLNIIERCHTQGERLAVQAPSDPHFQLIRRILRRLVASLSQSPVNA